jgi:hypothetical protein
MEERDDAFLIIVPKIGIYIDLKIKTSSLSLLG